MPRTPTPLLNRFWTKVKILPNGCWEWTSTIDQDGYALIWDNERQGLRRAHRVAFELLRDAIPDGLTIDHLCRNRGCVNPHHLEPVTNRENILRGESVTARHARKTHCEHGHPFDEENTYVRPGGGRMCKTCRAETTRRYYARKKAALR